MILVFGATGNVGGQVLSQLLAAGVPARAVTRDPVRATLPAGVEVVRGDLSDPSSLGAAFDGVSRAFVLADGLPGALEMARSAAVEHVVLLSSSSVTFEPPNEISRRHLDAEDAVRASGLGWTFLRPGNFMANSLGWAESVRAEGVVRAAYGSSVTAPVHERDIAAVAVAALTGGNGHVGQAYELTGPETLSVVDQVHILGTVLGEDIRFEELTPEQARAQFGPYVPAPIVDALMAMWESNDPAHARALPTVAEVTGREPATYREWVAEHAVAFR